MVRLVSTGPAVSHSRKMEVGHPLRRLMSAVQATCAKRAHFIYKLGIARTRIDIVIVYETFPEATG